MDRFGCLVWLRGNLLFMCPMGLENSPTFALKSHAGTSAARALPVCHLCCTSVCSSRIVIIRSPTNTCMLLRIKRVLDFKRLPDHAEQKPEDCTFLGLPLSLFLGCHGRIIQYTSIIAFVSLAYEHASYELILPLKNILVFSIHVKLVEDPYAQSQQQHTTSTLAVTFAAAISLYSTAGTAV